MKQVPMLEVEEIFCLHPDQPMTLRRGPWTRIAKAIVVSQLADQAIFGSTRRTSVSGCGHSHEDWVYNKLCEMKVPWLH